MCETPDVSVRRATATDAGVLADRGARTFTETFADDNTPEDLAAYVATSFSVEQPLPDTSRDRRP